MDARAEQILRFQADGDLAGVQAFIQRCGRIDAELHAAWTGWRSRGIPVDVVFEQGTSVLGF